MHGRQQILTDYKEITKDNIADVLAKSFKIHLSNVEEIKFLFNYERGIQPILNRKKEIRPEIDCKVVENHASEITTFKLGYEFGSPIAYVQRGQNDATNSNSDKDDKRISILNEIMFEESKYSKDQQLAKDFKVCGVGYRFIYPKSKSAKDNSILSPVDICVLSPFTTFVVYSNDAYKKPMMGVTYSILENGAYRLGCYTENLYLELDRNPVGTYNIKNLKIHKNVIGIIPIIEYKNDYERMGCFERVIPLMDALNVANSDRVNDISQHVQSILWLHNAEITEKEKDDLSNGGVIMTSNNNNQQAKIEYITSTLNQSETQTLVDYIYEQILQISGVPSREQSSGGNTGQAIMLSSGWQMAETMARSMELTFEESERNFLKVLLNIIKNLNDDVSVQLHDLRLSDISIRFSRNKTYDLLSKCNSYSSLINSGISPLSALKVISLFNDPQQVWLDSKPYYENIFNPKKIEEQDTKNNEQVVGNNSTSATQKLRLSDNDIHSTLCSLKDTVEKAINS